MSDDKNRVNSDSALKRTATNTLPLKPNPEYIDESNKQSHDEVVATIKINIEKNENIGNEENKQNDKIKSLIAITPRTDCNDKTKSPEINPLDITELENVNHVKIGTIMDDENAPFIGRLPSCSISDNIADDELSALRASSRRKWWSPTRFCDWCMHTLIFGKLMVMILTWTTVIDYGKDLYVTYHLGVLCKWWEFTVTLSILFLSLRLMLYLRAIDDSRVSFWKLLIFYLPGSVYADFQIAQFSDIGVCCFWEIAILFGTPFVPFYLIYLSMRKSISLFMCGDTKSFENEYLLSYAVVECLFETIPQLTLQTYLYFKYTHNTYNDHDEIEGFVFIIAWVISILVLIKIPIVVWYNRKIVYKLSFKRRHCDQIMSIKYHPIQDILATGSWDRTVLINNIIYHGNNNNNNNNISIKAKRVLDHHYTINCIAFMPKFINTLHDLETDIIAVAGQGVELFNWRNGKSIGQFPKTRERDQLKRKKRFRTKEVKQCVFSPDGKKLIWCQGKNVFVWNIDKKRQSLKIKCINESILGDVMSIDISPNGKYIACGLYQNQIKVYNSCNGDLIRIFKQLTASILCVKFDRKGKYIISGGADCKVRVFDLTSKFAQQIKQFDKHKSDVTCIAIDYTNKYIASGGRDKKIYITYLEDEKDDDDDDNDDISFIKPLKQLKEWKPYKTQRDITCCDFSPYGDTIAFASEDNQIHIVPLPKECHSHTKQHRLSNHNENIANK